MAIEYELILAGSSPVEQVAERAMPDPDERPTGTPPLLGADLYERYGFWLAILADSDYYLEAESDDGMWMWEPEVNVSLTFRMGKDVDLTRATINMLTVVRRVLDSGPEDAALILDGNWLLLTRFDGVLVKHRRQTWWDHAPAANDVIPG